MKTVSKFIINRDDNKFFYVEKYKLSKKSDRTKYLVHSSPKNVIEYSDHTFHSVHSLDEKVSISAFSKNAADNLITDLYNEKSQIAYDLLMEVYKKTSNDSNRLNPNLKGIKNNLLSGLKIYNESLKEFDRIYIPYEENYEILEVSNAKTNVREKVKNISSLISKNEDLDIEEIYNTPVKELVRTKKSA